MLCIQRQSSIYGCGQDQNSECWGNPAVCYLHTVLVEFPKPKQTEDSLCEIKGYKFLSSWEERQEHDYFSSLKAMGH